MLNRLMVSETKNLNLKFAIIFKNIFFFRNPRWWCCEGKLQSFTTRRCLQVSFSCIFLTVIFLTSKYSNSSNFFKLYRTVNYVAGISFVTYTIKKRRFLKFLNQIYSLMNSLNFEIQTPFTVFKRKSSTAQPLQFTRSRRSSPHPSSTTDTDTVDTDTIKKSAKICKY